MTPDERAQMERLCGQISTEQNSNEFMKLVKELNDLLERKQERLDQPEAGRRNIA